MLQQSAVEESRAGHAAGKGAGRAALQSARQGPLATSASVLVHLLRLLIVAGGALLDVQVQLKLLKRAGVRG